MSVADLPDEAWLAIAAVIGWTILQSLKAMCVHLDHEIRLHNLTIEARRMRQGYLNRLNTDPAAAARRPASLGYAPAPAPAPAPGNAPAPAPGNAPAAGISSEFVSDVEIIEEPDAAKPLVAAA